MPRKWAAGPIVPSGLPSTLPMPIVSANNTIQYVDEAINTSMKQIGIRYQWLLKRKVSTDLIKWYWILTRFGHGVRAIISSIGQTSDQTYRRFPINMNSKKAQGEQLAQSHLHRRRNFDIMWNTVHWKIHFRWRKCVWWLSQIVDIPGILINPWTISE